MLVFSVDGGEAIADAWEVHEAYKVFSGFSNDVRVIARKYQAQISFSNFLSGIMAFPDGESGRGCVSACSAAIELRDQFVDRLRGAHGPVDDEELRVSFCGGIEAGVALLEFSPDLAAAGDVVSGARSLMIAARESHEGILLSRQVAIFAEGKFSIARAGQGEATVLSGILSCRDGN